VVCEKPNRLAALFASSKGKYAIVASLPNNKLLSLNDNLDNIFSSYVPIESIYKK
jgi:hypothetical protein